MSIHDPPTASSTTHTPESDNRSFPGTFYCKVWLDGERQPYICPMALAREVGFVLVFAIGTGATYRILMLTVDEWNALPMHTFEATGRYDGPRPTVITIPSHLGALDKLFTEAKGTPGQ